MVAPLKHHTAPTMDGYFEQLLHQYGPGAVGVGIFLESSGLPLPGESLLIASALYASTGKMDIDLVVAFASLGAILGDNVGYLIGRSLGTRLLVRYGRHVGLTEERAQLGYHLFHRHGGKVVFFGRFIAILRTFAAVLAGANHMHWTHFLMYNALGGVTWCVLYGFGAYFLGDAFRRLAGPVGIAVGVLGLAVVAAALVFVKRNEKRLIAEAQQNPRNAVRQ
jgi:membrane protein DedA with SNARE-associated domain